VRRYSCETFKARPVDCQPSASSRQYRLFPFHDDLVRNILRHPRIAESVGRPVGECSVTGTDRCTVRRERRPHPSAAALIRTAQIVRHYEHRRSFYIVRFIKLGMRSRFRRRRAVRKSVVISRETYDRIWRSTSLSRRMWSVVHPLALLDSVGAPRASAEDRDITPRRLLLFNATYACERLLRGTWRRQLARILPSCRHPGPRLNVMGHRQQFRTRILIASGEGRYVCTSRPA